MKTALVLIATGARYHKYIEPLLSSASLFFVPHTPFLWTDSKARFTDQQFGLEDRGYPNTTLLRYHTFLTKADVLSKYKQIFYCDIDMKFVASVAEEEIFSEGITATLHPGFAHERTHPDGTTVFTCGSPERANRDSRAYIPKGTHNKYFCGGFNGGKAEAYLNMARQLRENINWDKENWGLGYSAIWHDESYMNRYLYDNPPAKILTPSFCYPERYDGGYGWAPELYPPKLLALNKGPR